MRKFVGRWGGGRFTPRALCPCYSIYGDTCVNDIVELWKDRFQLLLNCIQDENIEELPVNVSYSSDIHVTVADIESVIGHLDNNKSCGLDGIHAEYLKFCSRRILPLLAMCISALFIHGFLPDAMLSVVLVSVIQDKINVAKSMIVTIIGPLHWLV